MAYLRFLRIALASALLLTSSVSGGCTDPKVRKEWRNLRADERAAWIKAVECLTQQPHDSGLTATVDPAVSLIPGILSNSSNYDDFSYAHMDLNILIHYTGFFLPWHRFFVQALEDTIKYKCGYDGVHPYWDWTKDAADFYDATIWSDDENDGLGSWGDANNDYQITTGAFKDLKFVYPVTHNLRRNFTLQPFLSGGSFGSNGPSFPETTLMVNTTFTSTAVNEIVNSFTGDYIGFQASVESFSGPHSAIHAITGGDLGGSCPFGLTSPVCYGGAKWSPNDPMFFLHHAMIDKVWYDWQRRDPSNKNAFAGGTISWAADSNVSYTQYPTGAPPLLNTSSELLGDGLWEKTTIGDVLDTTGGRLCYIYE